MKKKIIIATVLVVLFIGGSILVFKRDKMDFYHTNIKSEDYKDAKLEFPDNIKLNGYDLVITRRDINCRANLIYVKSKEIKVIKDSDDNKLSELKTIKTDVDVTKILKYIKENINKNSYSGLYVITKDGDKGVIQGEDNILYETLRNAGISNSCRID
ncbi:MAG: hypothetical protein NC483_01660 [Ruminococcus sp.]|nr:hypothetical protein [Ruminococcus sp.]